jgi:hypothetical protein
MMAMDFQVNGLEDNTMITAIMKIREKRGRLNELGTTFFVKVDNDEDMTMRLAKG